jgi:hypothetical protein|tara:strand:- start:889 stop:1101 length:213 start_codon:yes stop_codon:yes gene_type:complete
MTQERELSRYNCVTKSVDTAFGKIYSHVDLDARGKVKGVAYSYPGKFEDTSVGDALEALSQVTRDTIKEF